MFCDILGFLDYFDVISLALVVHLLSISLSCYSMAILWFFLVALGALWFSIFFFSLLFFFSG